MKSPNQLLREAGLGELIWGKTDAGLPLRVWHDGAGNLWLSQKRLRGGESSIVLREPPLPIHTEGTTLTQAQYELADKLARGELEE